MISQYRTKFKGEKYLFLKAIGMCGDIYVKYFLLINVLFTAFVPRENFDWKIVGLKADLF